MKLKNVLSVVISLSVLFSATAANAVSQVDFTAVNGKTNSFRLTGNLKAEGTAEDFDTDFPTETFDSEESVTLEGETDFNGWTKRGNSGTAYNNHKVAVVQDTDSNWCIKASDRANEDGVKFDISRYLNLHGPGKYTVSFRMRADDKLDTSTGHTITTGGGKMVTYVMCGNGHTKKQLATKFMSGITKEWKTYSFDLDIDGFCGTAGCTSRTCTVATNSKGDNGTSLSITNNTYTITSSNKPKDIRDYYIDDFKMVYHKAAEQVTDEGALTADYTVKNGDTVLKTGTLTTDEDGRYDFFGYVDGNVSDCDDLSVNIKYSGSSASLDLTSVPHVKNTAPDFSVAYEGDKIRVLVNPYDYIKNSVGTGCIFAASYNASEILCDADMQSFALSGTGQTVDLYLGRGKGETKVKLFAFDSTGSIKPVGESLMNDDIALKTPTVYLIGDSVCQDYETMWSPATSASYHVREGWGQHIAKYFSENLTFDNRAGGGLTTQSFLTPDATESDGSAINHSPKKCSWPLVRDSLLKEGDFVIMALGVNDALINSEDPGKIKGTDEEEYKANIAQFKREAEAKGASIVFVTMPLRGTGSSGETNFENNHTKLFRERARMMIEAVDELGGVYVDLGKYQYEFYKNIQKQLMADGKTEQEAYEAVKEYFHAKNDSLHYSNNGANRLAEFIAYLIKNSNSPLAKYVNNFEIAQSIGEDTKVDGWHGEHIEYVKNGVGTGYCNCGVKMTSED